MKVKAVGKLNRNIGINIFYIDKPSPKANEVQIEVKAAAICGSDLHFYHWDEYAENAAKRSTNFFPHILGHEISGVVTEIGENVKEIKIGDRIALETHIPCNMCYYCKTGKMHICENVLLYGIHTNGAFTKYAIAPEICAVKIPNEITYIEAALLEPFGVAYHAIEKANIKPGDIVLITGCGPIGLFAQQLARVAGASKVFSTDIKEYRLELSKKIANVDEAINVSKVDPIKKIKEVTKGKGVDVIIELSGSSIAIEQIFKMVAKGGKIILVGTATSPVTIDTTQLIVYKEVEVYGITGRIMFNTWYKVMDIVANKLVNIESVISHKLPLEEAEKGFELIIQGNASKVILLP
ncbi:MAG: alcohol dehydrogenase catalytic domain-containing protein [Candidatus Methanomethylicaceae archaeon]